LPFLRGAPAYRSGPWSRNRKKRLSSRGPLVRFLGFSLMPLLSQIFRARRHRSRGHPPTVAGPRAETKKNGSLHTSSLARPTLPPARGQAWVTRRGRPQSWPADAGPPLTPGGVQRGGYPERSAIQRGRLPGEAGPEPDPANTGSVHYRCTSTRVRQRCTWLAPTWCGDLCTALNIYHINNFPSKLFKENIPEVAPDVQTPQTAPTGRPVELWLL
jgi:hypothetical protein